MPKAPLAVGGFLFAVQVPSTRQDKYTVQQVLCITRRHNVVWDTCTELTMTKGSNGLTITSGGDVVLNLLFSLFISV